MGQRDFFILTPSAPSASVKM